VACWSERRESGLPAPEEPHPATSSAAIHASAARATRLAQVIEESNFTFREYGGGIKSALIPTGPQSSWTQGEPGAETPYPGVPPDQAKSARHLPRSAGTGRSERSLRWLRRPRRPPQRRRRL